MGLLKKNNNPNKYEHTHKTFALLYFYLYDSIYAYKYAA